MRNILFIIVLILVMVACSKSEIDTWEVKPRVWFTEASDTLLFSFYSQPEEVKEYVLEIPISMAGMVSETEERTVTVKNLGGSPFNPGSEYEIISATIPAGDVIGVLRVKVQKTENLNMANDTIGFEICASEVFELGLTEDYWRNAIIISNLLSKPAWWDSGAERVLGYYSDKKMEVIYVVDGAYELFNSGDYGWYDDNVSVMIYKLNRYCKDHNIKYHPDDENVITFDFWSE